MRAISDLKFVTPTPIQSLAVPPLLGGRDLLAVAQTGTGKTAAFALPILQLLSAAVRPSARGLPLALILAPTRELALQIDGCIGQLARHLRLRSVVIRGGVARRPQVDRLARGADIVVGTPGRVLDLIGTRELRLDAVRHFVLDEADRMLDLGFIRDIRRIVAALPRQRQSMLFSATMPAEVARLAAGILANAERVEAPSRTITADRIDQSVYFVASGDKRALLSRLLQNPEVSRAIVFTRTKHLAGRVAEFLAKGGIAAEALHGNKSQPQRQRALDRFRTGKARVMVATDIAARGIDIIDVSHVINFDLPNVAEAYVHRIGRTARAGAAGCAVSFCDASEAEHLRGIEKLTGAALRVAGGRPVAPAAKRKVIRSGQSQRFRGRSRRPAEQRAEA